VAIARFSTFNKFLSLCLVFFFARPLAAEKDCAKQLEELAEHKLWREDLWRFTPIQDTLKKISKHAPKTGAGLQKIHWTLRNGVKLVFYPYVFTLKVPGRISRTWGRLKRGIELRNHHFLTSIPMDFIRHDGAHLSGYLIASALGYNIYLHVLASLELEQKFYLDELFAKEPPSEIKPHEKVLIVSGADTRGAFKVEDFLLKKYPHLAGKIDHRHVVNKEEYFDILDETKDGQYRYFVTFGHGRPGRVSLAAVNFFDFRSAFTADLTTSDLQSRAGHYPNLLAKNAKSYLVSCSIGEGDDGEAFMKAFSQCFSPVQAPVVASRELVLATDRESNLQAFQEILELTQEAASLRTWDVKDVSDFLQAHLVFLPAAAAIISGLDPGPSKLPPDQRVRVYQAPETSPAKP
jgi:hypothetical protein